MRDPVALEIRWKDTTTGEDHLQRWETTAGALHRLPDQGERLPEALFHDDLAVRTGLLANPKAAIRHS